MVISPPGRRIDRPLVRATFRVAFHAGGVTRSCPSAVNQIGAREEALRGVLITEDKGKEDKATASADPPRWQCSLSLMTRDKMGNACDSGGADVTCGFLLSPAAVMEEASTMHSGPENAGGTHQASRTCQCHVAAPVGPGDESSVPIMAMASISKVGDRPCRHVEHLRKIAASTSWAHQHPCST